MIQLDNVKKAFNQDKPNEFWAIRGVSLQIEKDQIVVLKGPSGSGKTTLLSMIGCLSRPTSGRIYFQDKLLSNLPERFMTEIRRETFGFVFQHFNLIKGLTVLENVMLPAYPNGPDYSQLKQRAQALLQQFNIHTKASYKVEWLSGGEAQRTAICRALINDPGILIADEPTANLDSKLSHEFMLLLETLKEMGKSVILSSHDPLVFESSVIGTLLEMRDGLMLDAD